MGHCNQETESQQKAAPRERVEGLLSCVADPWGMASHPLICSRCPGCLIREGQFCRKLKGERKGQWGFNWFPAGCQWLCFSCFWYRESRGQVFSRWCVPSLFQHRQWVRSMSQYILTLWTTPAPISCISFEQTLPVPSSPASFSLSLLPKYLFLVLLTHAMFHNCPTSHH